MCVLVDVVFVITLLLGQGFVRICKIKLEIFDVDVVGFAQGILDGG